MTALRNSLARRSSLRWVLAVAACCFLFAQTWLAAHEADADAHVGDVACEQCESFAKTSTPPPAASGPVAPLPVADSQQATLTTTLPSAPLVDRPPVRAPPAS